MKKLNIWFVFTLLIVFGILIWKNPGSNYDTSRIDYCIGADKKQQHVTIISMQHFFDIAYVKNAQSDYPSPYFPAIHIKAKSVHNAWLHVVQTDCIAESKWLHFIDACPQGHKYYPFYAVDTDFVDNPCWSYSVFSKPLSFWIGHAYAVQVDHKKKTIECVGGISWGFKLSWWNLNPIMILPFALTQSMWQQDWKFFQKALPEYENIGN
ncbi:hypothetical protein KBB68_03215 [Candidatus Babeliales bacterium]|nr:hypothetical protein [Candidatus Babeliales bacterium]